MRCLGLATLLCTLPLFAGEKESSVHLFSHCFDFSTVRFADRINPALLATVCYFLKRYNKTYFHHSGWRSSSYNHSGNALDFHLTDYRDMSRRQILKAFSGDVKLLESFLRQWGLLDKVGLGIYPQTPNPFIHLDLRGVRARWGELEGREVSFASAWNWLQGKLAQ